jgi:hypothetical protein
VRRQGVVVGVVVALLLLVGGGTVAIARPWSDSRSASGSTFAAASEFPPVLRQLPVVLGAPQAALPLRATSGGFAPATTSATYTWLRCNAAGASCAAIAGAGTTADYTAAAADVGSTIRVDMTPVNGSTAGVAVRSEPSQVVLAQGAGPSIWSPVTTNTPTITGTATVGQTLTGTTGTWVQLLGIVQWQWERCDATGAGCAPIAGATSQTYAPTATDRGRRLSLTVTVNVLNLARTKADTDSTAIVT